MIYLDDSDIHIYIADSQNYINSVLNFSGILSEQEIEKADKLINEQVRFNFIFRHIQLRNIISLYADINPGEIIFSTNEYKKPFIIQPKELQFIQFNLSYSENIHLIAISKNDELGVDIEKIKPIDDFDRIIQDNFSSYEINLLNKFNGNEKLRLFFKIWCGKEAFIKAIGKGFYFQTASFSIILDKQNNYCGIEIEQNNTINWDSKHWNIDSINVANNFITSIVHSKQNPKILLTQLFPD